MSKQDKPYTGKIVARQDVKKLQQLFATEDTTIQERATLTITEKDNTVVFSIAADDATALRAMMNMVLKNLTIYEQTKELP